ncbi:MAG: hypothetical protein ACXWNB_00650 [Candidatus Binataceae bacterium]
MADAPDLGYESVLALLARTGAIGVISSLFARGTVRIVPIAPVPTNSSAKVTQKPDSQIGARVAFLLRICNPLRADNPAKSLVNFTDFGAAFAEFGGAWAFA